MWHYAWASRPNLVKGVRFWWNHRHETSEEREARILASRRKHRAAFDAEMKKLESMPEDREWMEMRRELEEIVTRVFGPSEKVGE